MIAKEDTDLKPEHISAVMDLLKKEKTTAEIKQS